jgi:hypothetical protein
VGTTWRPRSYEQELNKENGGNYTSGNKVGLDPAPDIVTILKSRRLRQDEDPTRMVEMVKPLGIRHK